MDRLGGTLSHLESELGPEMRAYPLSNKPTTLKQKQTLSFIDLTARIFQNGLMDLLKNLQEVVEKISLKHRELNDLPQLGTQKAQEITNEIKLLVKESPSLRLVFLCPTGKDALLKLGTWFLALLNCLDTQAETKSPWSL